MNTTATVCEELATQYKFPFVLYNFFSNSKIKISY